MRTLMIDVLGLTAFFAIPLTKWLIHAAKIEAYQANPQMRQVIELHNAKK